MTETNLVSQFENLSISSEYTGSRVGLVGDFVKAEIDQQLHILSHKTKETNEDLTKMSQEQESFALIYHECTKLNAQLQSIAQTQPQQCVEYEMKIRRLKEQQEQTLNRKVASILQLRLTFADKLKDTIAKLNITQSRVLDEELIRCVHQLQIIDKFLFL